MLRIKRPTTPAFLDMLEDGDSDIIRNAFAIHLTDDLVLSFVTEKHLIFLTKDEVKRSFDIFALTVKMGSINKEPMEETLWADEFQEDFAKRVRKEAGLKKAQNPYWFYSLIEVGFDFYVQSTLTKFQKWCEIKK